MDKKIIYCSLSSFYLLNITYLLDLYPIYIYKHVISSPQRHFCGLKFIWVLLFSILSLSVQYHVLMGPISNISQIHVSKKTPLQHRKSFFDHSLLFHDSGGQFHLRLVHNLVLSFEGQFQLSHFFIHKLIIEYFRPDYTPKHQNNPTDMTFENNLFVSIRSTNITIYCTSEFEIDLWMFQL